VELLLDHGAGANDPIPSGETPLMTCARTGKVDAVKALLNHGAEVNAKETHGQTALMWAAAEGNADAVKALLAAGADPHARLDSGFTPFLFAVREGRQNVAEVLLAAGIDVNEKIVTKKSPTKTPSQANSPPANGTSALSLAVGNAHFDLASYLLDKGADPNAADQGWTPLHIITWVRKPGGGDNDPAPIGSGTMTSLELVKKLVAKGANINARMTRKISPGLTSLNTMGATPFFCAARTADAELMRALAKLGADPLIKNADESTALMAAAGLGTRSPGEDAGTEPEVLEAMQAALDLGVDIDAVDKNGETAMHGAAYKNLPEAVLFLARKGAKKSVWNQPNTHGWTPLTIAEGHRFGNFKPSFVTIEAFHKIMASSEQSLGH
jgi:ankyrin repeat protein